MADQQKLKDAKIEVKLDTEAARKQLEELARGMSGKSTPGGAPPKPGRDTGRDDDGRRPARRGTAVVATSTTSPLYSAVKAGVAAVSLAAVAEVVPSMIEARLKTLSDGDYVSKAIVKVLEYAVGVPFDALASLLRNAIPQLQLLSTLKQTGVDVSRASRLLVGDTASPSDITTIVRRAMAITSVEIGAERFRRAAARDVLGGVILETSDALREALLGKGVTR